MILPQNKHYLLEALKEAQEIIASLPVKQECKNCKQFKEGYCIANNEMQIPAEVLPLGCKAWEWDEVPF